MRTLAAIIFGVIGAMAFDDAFDGWWWSFVGAVVGILAFRSVEWIMKKINTWSGNRQAQRLRETNTTIAEERLARSVENAMAAGRNHPAELLLGMLEEDEDLLQQDEDDMLEEALDAAMDGEEPFTIKVAARGPNLDPDAEECDAWIDVNGEPPRSYEREKGQHSAWKQSPTGYGDNIMLDCGDVVLSVVVISDPALVSVSKDLSRCNKRSQLTATTIRSMEGMDGGKALALCHLTGFSMEEWEDTHHERISIGKRVIDLGD